MLAAEEGGCTLPKGQLPYTGSQWTKSWWTEGGGDTQKQHGRLDSHLQFGHQWSNQCHLGCFRYSQSSVPGWVYFHLLSPVPVESVWQLMPWVLSGPHAVNFSTWWGLEHNDRLCSENALAFEKELKVPDYAFNDCINHYLLSFVSASLCFLD